MSSQVNTKIFNNSQVLVSGWYWLMPSKELKKKPKASSLFGKDLVVYRGKDGKARALDAYCPHMGAHLAEGKVDGNEIRCMFHGWKFDQEGVCTDIPCLDEPIKMRQLTKYPIEEKYGLVWVWTGSEKPCDLPEVPQLEGQEVDYMFGRPFIKNCHPNVMMINAIDAQHFNTVHPMVKKLAGSLRLSAEPRSQEQIEFKNTTGLVNGGFLNAILKPWYKGALTYWLSYWFGSTGTVTIGPDFFRFHIMFTLRPTLDGKAEGRTILITKKRRFPGAKAFNWAVLRITKVVGDYFAKGDTEIFRSIRFKFESPILADQPIIKFVQHAERQPVSPWSHPTAVEG